MVFHYVAKIKEAPEGSTREMKVRPRVECLTSVTCPQVCFRHSKHSIKCDINAPCPECDAGLKLYSHDQCRRHLDVVRAERRFESIEVDRAENLIERLAELDGLWEESNTARSNTLSPLRERQTRAPTARRPQHASRRSARRGTHVARDHVLRPQRALAQHSARTQEDRRVGRRVARALRRPARRR